MGLESKPDDPLPLGEAMFGLLVDILGALRAMESTLRAMESTLRRMSESIVRLEREVRDLKRREDASDLLEDILHYIKSIQADVENYLFGLEYERQKQEEEARARSTDGEGTEDIREDIRMEAPG